MSVHCFTSFSFSYLNRARVLVDTVKRFHPDWTFWAVITDELPESFKFDLSKEKFDRILWGQHFLGVESEAWLFRHDIVEACTAVKGFALQAILDAGAHKVIYLDPDIAVFSPLDEVVANLDAFSILLTPHQLKPETTLRSVRDNEITSLRLGTYNLGFLAIRNDTAGRSMADWWAARLQTSCFDEPQDGIFVDQKWCDLVPALFERVGVLRDPGLNVASWNLSNRQISINLVGEILVNESPLKFFHFTKLGPIGDIMTRRYAGNNTDVYEVWLWYKNAVRSHTDDNIPTRWWHFSTYENGETIKKADRVLYRTRNDLQRAFPDPFSVGSDTYYNWLQNNTD